RRLETSVSAPRNPDKMQAPSALPPGGVTVPVIHFVQPATTQQGGTMLQLTHGAAAANCQGLTRRTALKAGFLGLLGLGTADLLRLKARGAASSDDRAVILLWLDGGPSQLETYDPKPDAPAEYRGPYGVIQTKVPGIILSDKLPHHARHADKMVFVRSLHHDN